MEAYDEELVSTNRRLVGVIPLMHDVDEMTYVDLAVSGLMAADDVTPPFSTPLHFLALRYGHKFPIRKCTRATWCLQDGSGVDDGLARSTRGILKTGWLWKHTLEIPAALLCILKLDLSIPQEVWAANLNTVVENVKELEQCLSTRGIRILILMMCQGTPNGEEMSIASLAEQRRMDFTNIVDEAYVFIVSEEELASSAVHQNAMNSIVLQLRDMTSDYYHSAIESIQKKEYLLVSLLPLYKPLLVRMRVKLGVLFEATGSKDHAFQYMQSSFSLLRELMISARDCDESSDGYGKSIGCGPWQGPAACWQIRAVAEVVQLRILRHFLLNQRDTTSAIAFNRSYLASFGPNPRGVTRNDGPTYKIYAWMAQQHAAFAEMLGNHVAKTKTLLSERNGFDSANIGTQEHVGPGKSWYSSAVYALLRQAAATQSLGHQGERKILTIPSASLSILPPAFMGQEAEIVVKIDVSLADPQQAWEVIEDVLDNREVEVDHATLSKQRINTALVYYHSGRRRHTLLCWLAEIEAQLNENEAASEHWRDALEGVDGFLEDGWGSLSKDALLGISQVAQKVNKWGYATSALLTLGCESMGQWLSDAERRRYVHEAFLVGKRESIINVHVWPRSRSLGRFLLCCGRFECTSACVGTVVQFKLYIRSTLALPVVASSLLIRFQPTSHGLNRNIELKHKLGAMDPCAHSASRHQFEVDLTLNPGCLHIFSIPLLLSPPSSQMHAREGELLSLCNISATLCIENDRDLEGCILHMTSEATNEAWLDWHMCWGHVSMKVLKPVSRAQISIKEANPPIRGVLNRMCVVINSNGDAITGGTLTVETIPPPSRPTPRESLFWRPVDDTETIFEPVTLGPNLQPMEPITIPELEGGDINGSVEISLWIRGIEEGEAGPIAISLRLQYGDGSGSVGHTIQFSPIHPLDAATSILVGANDILDGKSNSYTFVVETSLRCIQDQSLQLLRIEYSNDDGDSDSCEILQDAVLYDSMESDRMEEGVKLNRDDMFNVCLNARRSSSSRSLLGSLWVYWIRSDDAAHIATHSSTLGQMTLVAATEIKLPNPSDVEVSIPFTVTVPPTAKVGIAFNMCWKLYNSTGLHQDVKLLMSNGDDFVWSGAGERVLHLPPDKVTSVLYTLIPLHHGHLRLPVMSLFWERMKQELSTPHLSEWIFVTP